MVQELEASNQDTTDVSTCALLQSQNKEVLLEGRKGILTVPWFTRIFKICVKMDFNFVASFLCISTKFLKLWRIILGISRP